MLLDLSLPDSHGLETLARWQAAAPTLPVIVLTGSFRNDTKDLALKAGASVFFNKPYSPSDLAREVRRLLDL